MCVHTIFERTASDALCCAAPEATRGHYEARGKLLNLVQPAGPGATTEVPELIPSRPALRPADICIAAALPGRRAALDIGACSPGATNAGVDCCESMWWRKKDRYSEHFEEVAAQIDCWLGALSAAPREVRELGADALAGMQEQCRVAMVQSRYGL